MVISQSKRVIGPLLSLAAILLIGGCGAPGPSGADVAGTVTFDGAPVVDGQISFESDKVAAATIKDGKFAGKVPEGKYKVKITATREDGVAPDGLPNFVMYIPKKYNEQTTLEEEVKAGKNEFKFDLTK